MMFIELLALLTFYNTVSVLHVRAYCYFNNCEVTVPRFSKFNDYAVVRDRLGASTGQKYFTK